MAAPEQEARVPSEIQELLRLYSSLTLIDNGQKVKCELSSHEMPCKLDAINSYVNGKKFKKLHSQNEFDYNKYKEHLVPNNKKRHENHLFCKLTLRTINRQPEHVLRHVNGKRFKKALARWQECKKNGTKFVPRGKRAMRESGSDEAGTSQKKEVESAESDDESDVDSLSDLYPVEDSDAEVDDAQGDSGSDFDFGEDGEHLSSGGDEDMETVSSEVSSQKKKGKKRKSGEHVVEASSSSDKKGKKRKSEEASVKPKKAKFEKTKSKPKTKKVKK